MATAVQQRRGTTSEHSSFGGLEGEITVDTELKTVIVHDGSGNAGSGTRLAKYSEIEASDTLAELNDTTINSPVAGQFLQWNGSSFINYTDLVVTASGTLVYAKNGVPYLELQNAKKQANGLTASSQEFTGAINFSGYVIDTDSDNTERLTVSSRILSQFTNIRDNNDDQHVEGKMFLEVQKAGATGYSQANSNPKNVMILEPDYVTIGVDSDDLQDPTQLTVNGNIICKAGRGSVRGSLRRTSTNAATVDATLLESLIGDKIIAYGTAAKTYTFPEVSLNDSKNWIIINTGTGASADITCGITGSTRFTKLNDDADPTTGLTSIVLKRGAVAEFTAISANEILVIGKGF